MVRDRSVFTEAEQETIRHAASQILAHPAFRASERSTRLFRYLLERALLSDDEVLKERRIGHEVFGREISYDTSDDPIVRNAASDTRKRLRQYDAEAGSGLPVHILLGPGGYALEFRFEQAVEHPAEKVAEVASVLPEALPAARPPRATGLARPGGSKLPWWIAAVATAACILFGLAFFWERQELRSGVTALSDNPLWSPMLNSGKEIFVCLGHAGNTDPQEAPTNPTSVAMQRITITDLKAYTNISGFLQMNRQNFQMRTDNQTTLLDLRDRPTVLIGIGNNQWALRLTSNLRYHFDFSHADPKNPQRAVSIVDSEHPGQTSWIVRSGLNATTDSDYAIAGRLLDPVTGGLILYVAGAGTVGTQVASEFVTQSAFLTRLPESLKNPRTNIQVVLKTPIVGGIPGKPEVLATHVY
ncbi:hypothetical protein [Terriglobus roseus]|uniref:Uncharacterized protein n=1 Tax=Terriglobus roseus TaxID=392734 RepID=A0A1H4JZB5_9BACT|nr:hypothetical protein [Terriglobus roseus]SEB51205.1 hypothetical protein SAMN05443244_0889 [Terriglobus roseus]